MWRSPRTPVGVILSCLAVATLGLLGVGTLAEEKPSPQVIQVRLQSIIHPVAADFVVDSLAEADATDAVLFVMQLDTPGGLLTSTRKIFTAMLNADTPVVVYVAPSGAQAASAGFFLLMAADVAAMAPGTNTGAAHPVDVQGQDVGETMAEKVEQDAAATIRSLASQHGRNAELAEEAVIESRSFTADEALEAGLVDLVAVDLVTLLEEIDGREVEKKGTKQILKTAVAVVQEIEMSPLERFLSAIAHPNIAYILLTLGSIGLLVELYNPGAIFPGVVGAICLVLAFFALSVLPVNYAGLALLGLALIFFIAEIKVTSYGLLTVAGVISLVLGSLMLFRGAEPSAPELRVSLDVLISLVLFVVLVVALLMSMVVKAHRNQVRTGLEGLIHERGEARSELDPRGSVFVHGELWTAVSEEVIAKGEPVEVVGVDGMILKVRPYRET